MLMRRGVVTGVGGVTALGDDWPGIRACMLRGQTAIRFMQEWQRFSGLNTRLAAPIAAPSFDKRYPRKKMRTMGLVSKMAVLATERALEDAGLVDAPVLTGGRCGIAYGSSFGSAGPVVAFAELMMTRSSPNLNPPSYIHIMHHTPAV